MSHTRALKEARNLGSGIFIKLVTIWHDIVVRNVEYTRTVFLNVANTRETPFTGPCDLLVAIMRTLHQHLVLLSALEQ